MSIRVLSENHRPAEECPLGFVPAFMTASVAFLPFGNTGLTFEAKYGRITVQLQCRPAMPTLRCNTYN